LILIITFHQLENESLIGFVFDDYVIGAPWPMLTVKVYFIASGKDIVFAVFDFSAQHIYNIQADLLRFFGPDL
jgi:hypothetical protein